MPSTIAKSSTSFRCTECGNVFCSFEEAERCEARDVFARTHNSKFGIGDMIYIYEDKNEKYIITSYEATYHRVYTTKRQYHEELTFLYHFEDSRKRSNCVFEDAIVLFKSRKDLELEEQRIRDLANSINFNGIKATYQWSKKKYKFVIVLEEVDK